MKDAAELEQIERELPRVWNWVFRIEIPLTAGSVLYWLVDPATYLRSIYGIERPDVAHVGLLCQLAVVTGSIFVLFYTRTLLARRVLLMPFAHLQEALVVSDVALAAVAFASSNGTARTAEVWAIILVALLWAAIRLGFLINVRGG